jgi:hypothetical protein
LAATIQENVDIQAFTLYNMGFNQKLNNLDFIWANPAFRCIPDNKNYGKCLFFNSGCRFNQG